MRKATAILVVAIAAIGLTASHFSSGSASPERVHTANVSLAGWGSPAYVPSTTTSTSTTTTVPSPPPPTKSRVAQKPRSRQASAPAPQGGDFWRKLANCESRDGSSGTYTGYFQMSSSNASHYGITGSSSYDQQKAAAQDLAAHSDPYHQWPVCWNQAMTNGPRTQ